MQISLNNLNQTSSYQARWWSKRNQLLQAVIQWRIIHSLRRQEKACSVAKIRFCHFRSLMCALVPRVSWQKNRQSVSKRKKGKELKKLSVRKALINWPMSKSTKKTSTSSTKRSTTILSRQICNNACLILSSHACRTSLLTDKSSKSYSCSIISFLRDFSTWRLVSTSKRAETRSLTRSTSV